jgi:anti-anti-sigma regulatory factor
MRVEVRQHLDVAVVVPIGVLDLSTYTLLRDTLLKCAMEVPRAVVVDLAALRVAPGPTLAVFAAVAMRVAEWPDVPIVLVVADPEYRARLTRHGIDRYLRVHTDLDTALGAPPREVRPRRRAVADLGPPGDAAPYARRVVKDTCGRWGCSQRLTEDALVVANALVDNAVRHASGDPSMRLELRHGRLTVAIYDDGPEFVPPGREGATVPLGLGLVLVDRLASAWGCASALQRKVVWAVLHPS